VRKVHRALAPLQDDADMRDLRDILRRALPDEQA
jgi:hypothetical protein